MDHLYQLPALGGADQPMLEAYTLLGALAARTKRAELGTLVTGVTYRNPALLAKQVTTLDVISRGRAVLGIGAAWHDVEHVAFGYDFPSAGERLDRLEEAVQICRAMFTEPAATFRGATTGSTASRTCLARCDRAAADHDRRGRGAPYPGARRPLRGSLQRLGRSRHRPAQAGGAPEHCRDIGRDPATIRTTRLGGLFLAPSASAADETRRMVADVARTEFAAASTIGTADEVTEQVAAILDAGIDEPIFNLPFAPPATVREVGASLTERFAAVAD